MTAAKNRRRAEWLLAAVIVARSTSYLFSKTALDALEPFTLLSLRFLSAFFLLSIPFRKKLRGLRLATIVRGAALGGSFFLGMAAGTRGLCRTSTTTASLLENTSIILVPLIEAILLRRLPRRGIVLGAGCSFCGIVLLLWDGGLTLQSGAGLCLLAAVCHAVSTILADRFSHRDDPLTLGLLEIGFLGAFSLPPAFLLETPAPPASAPVWGAVLWLAVVCSCIGFVLQPVAQRHIPSERAALFFALSPLSASMIGIFFRHETLSLPAVPGIALILWGIVLSDRGLPPSPLRRAVPASPGKRTSPKRMKRNEAGAPPAPVRVITFSYIKLAKIYVPFL